jgi:hypothetical protein
MDLEIRLSFVKTLEFRRGGGVEPRKPPPSVHHWLEIALFVVIYIILAHNCGPEIEVPTKCYTDIVHSLTLALHILPYFTVA